MPISKEKNLQIRNSTAEFLIFTRQAGEDGIEVRVADETVWLTQKLIGVLRRPGGRDPRNPGERAEVLSEDHRHLRYGDGLQAIAHGMVFVTNDRMRAIRDVAPGMNLPLLTQNWAQPNGR